MLVSGALDGTIIVWDAHKATKIRTINFHKGQITNLVLIARPLNLYGLTAPKPKYSGALPPFEKYTLASILRFLTLKEDIPARVEFPSKPSFESEAPAFPEVDLDLLIL